MRSKFVFAILMLALASVLVAVQIRSSPGLVARSPKLAPAAAVEETREPAAEGQMAAATESSSAATPAPADPEFQQWLRRQAQQIDNTKVNPDSVQDEMNARVKALTKTQTRQLLQTARSNSAPAAEKILSTYMLVEAGPMALAELRELITAPLEHTAPAEAHSSGELDSVREKTLKIMAIDGLASRAQSDPAARDALAKAVSELQDPSVKKYAQDQYNRISHQ